MFFTSEQERRSAIPLPDKSGESPCAISMTNQTIEWSGVVTALSSIYHGGGQSIGINSKLRREKFVQPDGTVEDVPVISGNGLRGLLRDRGMFHMCRTLGYGVNEETGEVRGLPLPAFYFLFSGGALTKDTSKGLDIDKARELRSLIPLVGVFGGALGNQIMPGKLKVDKMIPICAEITHLLPEPWRDAEVASIWEYLQEEMYTRKDDEKHEHLRQLIEPEARALLETAAAAKRNAPSQPVMETDTGQKQQMRYFLESFAAGTKFFWSLVLDDVTDVEFDAFCVALGEFARMPYIGAKSNVGLGRVSVHFDRWHTVDARQATGNQLDTPLGKRYQAHLEQHGDAIREMLGEMV